MYDELTLPNGLRIIGERIPHFRSVSVGLWVGAGSQYEENTLPGISHFIEHMLFKGTARYSAKELAEIIDAVGGQLNAFTSKECTCFYAKVVDEHLHLAMDVISDMVLHSLLKEDDIEREKGVVLEEIAMSEDSPEDVVNDLVMVSQFGDQPLSRNILGTEESVSSIEKQDILAYMEKMYRPENAVLAVAGNYDLDMFVAMAKECFGAWEGNRFQKMHYVTKPAKPTLCIKKKDIEQLHICIGYPCQKLGSDDAYAISLFNSVFGGAASSRLFQSIREEKGLAYSVYSYPTSFTDCGQFTIYAGVNPENAEEVLALIEMESQKILREGITEREFLQGKEQLKGSYVLGLESTSNRMQMLGRRKLLLNETLSETQVLEKINAMTYDDVCRVCHDILTAEKAIAFVGKNPERIHF